MEKVEILLGAEEYGSMEIKASEGVEVIIRGVEFKE